MATLIVDAFAIAIVILALVVVGIGWLNLRNVTNDTKRFSNPKGYYERKDPIQANRH